MTSKLPNETTKRSVGLIDENRAHTGIDGNPLASRLFDAAVARGNRINPGIGSLAVDIVHRLVGPEFIGDTIDTNFWTLAENGTGGDASLSGSLITLTSGTSNSGSGSLESVHHARFLFVNPNEFRMASRITNITIAECTRRWGALDITAGTPLTLNSGFYFSLDGTGALSVNHKVAGSGVVSVASGSFNGDVSLYTMDTNVHAYEILYYVMGAWFFIDGVFIHKFTPTTLMLVNDNNLHATAESVNSASGTTSGVMEVLSTSILRLGALATQPVCVNLAANATTVLKRSPGKLHRIVVNKFGANSVITVYDNTAASGTLIATIGSQNEGSFEYGCEFQIGLTIVIGGGTASDITVVYD